MKKGFTLAEVLVTLVILGVVAAMTIPTVIGNTRDAEYKAKAKKTFSMLTQAFAMASLQGYAPVHTVADGDAQNILDWFDKYLVKNLSTMKRCTDMNPRPVGYEGLGQCWQGTNKGLNGKSVYCATSTSVGAGVVQAILNDGTFINMDSYGSGSMNTFFGYDTGGGDGLVVFFDVNGAKKPNVLGKDVYVAVYDKGTLAPAYVSKSDEEALDECSSNHAGPNGYGNGYACLKVIMDKALQ